MSGPEEQAPAGLEEQAHRIKLKQDWELVVNGLELQPDTLQACIEAGQMSYHAVNSLLDQENFKHDWGVGAHIKSKNRAEMVLALNRALLSFYATSPSIGLAHQKVYTQMLSDLDDDAKKKENTASSDTHGEVKHGEVNSQRPGGGPDADGEMMETGYEVDCEVQYFKDKFTWPATVDKVTRSQGEQPVYGVKLPDGTLLDTEASFLESNDHCAAWVINESGRTRDQLQNIYEGPVDDQRLAHGDGTMTFKFNNGSGAVFTGAFEHGVPTHGVKTFEDGDTDTGTVDQSCILHGNGCVRVEKGVRTEGRFEHGKFDPAEEPTAADDSAASDGDQTISREDLLHWHWQALLEAEEAQDWPALQRMAEDNMSTAQTSAELLRNEALDRARLRGKLRAAQNLLNMMREFSRSRCAKAGEDQKKNNCCLFAKVLCVDPELDAKITSAASCNDWKVLYDEVYVGIILMSEMSEPVANDFDWHDKPLDDPISTELPDDHTFKKSKTGVDGAVDAGVDTGADEAAVGPKPGIRGMVGRMGRNAYGNLKPVVIGSVAGPTVTKDLGMKKKKRRRITVVEKKAEESEEEEGEEVRQKKTIAEVGAHKTPLVQSHLDQYKEFRPHCARAENLQDSQERTRLAAALEKKELDWLRKQAQEIQDRDKNRKRADDWETYHDQETDYWKGSSHLEELDESVKLRSYQDMTAKWSNAPEAVEDAPKAAPKAEEGVELPRKKKHRGGRKLRAAKKKGEKGEKGNFHGRRDLTIVFHGHGPGNNNLVLEARLNRSGEKKNILKDADTQSSFHFKKNILKDADTQSSFHFNFYNRVTIVQTSLDGVAQEEVLKTLDYSTGQFEPRSSEVMRNAAHATKMFCGALQVNNADEPRYAGVYLVWQLNCGNCTSDAQVFIEPLAHDIVNDLRDMKRVCLSARRATDAAERVVNTLGWIAKAVSTDEASTEIQKAVDVTICTICQYWLDSASDIWFQCKVKNYWNQTENVTPRWILLKWVPCEAICEYLWSEGLPFTEREGLHAKLKSSNEPRAFECISADDARRSDRQLADAKAELARLKEQHNMAEQTLAEQTAQHAAAKHAAELAKLAEQHDAKLAQQKTESDAKEAIQKQELQQMEKLKSAEVAETKELLAKHQAKEAEFYATLAKQTEAAVQASKNPKKPKQAKKRTNGKAVDTRNTITDLHQGNIMNSRRGTADNTTWTLFHHAEGPKTIGSPGGKGYKFQEGKKRCSERDGVLLKEINSPSKEATKKKELQQMEKNKLQEEQKLARKRAQGKAGATTAGATAAKAPNDLHVLAEQTAQHAAAKHAAELAQLTIQHDAALAQQKMESDAKEARQKQELQQMEKLKSEEVAETKELLAKHQAKEAQTQAKHQAEADKIAQARADAEAQKIIDDQAAIAKKQLADQVATLVQEKLASERSLRNQLQPDHRRRRIKRENDSSDSGSDSRHKRRRIQREHTSSDSGSDSGKSPPKKEKKKKKRGAEQEQASEQASEQAQMIRLLKEAAEVEARRAEREVFDKAVQDQVQRDRGRDHFHR